MASSAVVPPRADGEGAAAATNGTMMQFFVWDLPNDGQLWNQLRDRAEELSRAGVSAVWIPPCYKADAQDSVGYSVYDLWDLGEFDQKGTVRTKYGTKEELLAAVKALHRHDVHVYADVVLNHRVGADETEDVYATPYHIMDRTQQVGERRLIRAWTKFTCAGRGGAHSAYVWTHDSFDAVDYDERVGPENPTQVYLLDNHVFDRYTSLERGNFDYLIGADTDTDRDHVVEELIRWGQWLSETLQLDGFRIDALKHMDLRFYSEKWLPAVRAGGRDLFAVGEYWDPEVRHLQCALDLCANTMSLMDVPLQRNFREASADGNGYDMTRIFEGTLVGCRPTAAVTFVANHDTTYGQGLESIVQDWFVPLAYALILLRRDGYPCLFYGDYYGGVSQDKALTSFRDTIDKLLALRRDHAHGVQTDYFVGCRDNDDADAGQRQLIGWTRAGNTADGHALAVVLSSGSGGCRSMHTEPNARFTDALGNCVDDVCADGEGWAAFPCQGGSVSVWVEV